VDDEFRVMELLKMILKPGVPMECQPVRNPTAFHKMWIKRAKDLFSVLPLVVFLILVGCGGGSGTSSGAASAAVASTRIASISVAPANPSIPVGVTKQFAASGAYSNGTSQDITTQVAWSSTNPSVVTVTPSGLATAITPGTATINAITGDFGGNTTLTVTSATLSSIAVTPAKPSMPVGLAEQFTASGTYSDGTSHDITTQVTWQSSNPSVASINSSGLGTPITPGTATITATSGSISGNTTFTVTSATLSSIAVTPANPSIPVGLAKQFTASGTYSDGTNHDITAQVTWQSSNPSVATVNGSGLATAASAGTATITATSGSISANTILTVSSGGAGGTINLAWNPSTGPGLAGYKVYYGTASRAYSNSTDVGNVTTYDLTGLTKGQTFFIATTAYDTSHNESGYSNEVSGVAK